MIGTIDDASVGANFDQAPEEMVLGAWSGVRNVRFLDGAAERFSGIASVFAAPSATPYGLHQFDTPTARYWIEAGLATIYADDGTTRHNLTPASPPTGAADDRWSLGSFSGYAVANNGKDKPWTWDGNTANDFISMASWPATWIADVVVPFGVHLVALGVSKSGTKQPHTVAWSQSAQPGQLPTTWTSAATNDAGERDLVSKGVMVDAVPMGNALVVYKEASMWLMTRIGGEEVMQTVPLPGNVGAMWRGCVVDTPVGHVVLTNGDVVIHQGQGVRSILNGRMRKWLFQTIDATAFRRAFLVPNYKRSEVWVCFPENGNTTCNLALVWNWADDKLAVRELAAVTCGAFGQIPAALSAPATWDADTGTWDSDATTWDGTEYLANDLRTMLGSAAAFGLVDTGTSDYGNNMTATLERRGLHFGTPTRVKTAKSVFPRFDGTTGTVISVQLGGAMKANEGPVWSPAVDFTVGNDQKADIFATGRFLAIRFTSRGAGLWRLRSLDIDGRVGGAF